VLKRFQLPVEGFLHQSFTVSSSAPLAKLVWLLCVCVNPSYSRTSWLLFLHRWSICPNSSRKKNTSNYCCFSLEHFVHIALVTTETRILNDGEFASRRLQLFLFLEDEFLQLQFVVVIIVHTLVQVYFVLFAEPLVRTGSCFDEDLGRRFHSMTGKLEH